MLILGDRLALPVGGKTDGLTARHWQAFAAYCGLSKASTADVARSLAAAQNHALALVERCHLSQGSKEAYATLVQERGATLVRLAG